MRLLCPSSCALKPLRTPSALVRNGQRRFLRTRAYDVAVIGGGITGLTAAYRLSKDPSCSKVTLYEKSPRLGGWLQSETVDVDGGRVVFDYGPRTLRVQSIPPSYPLLHLLGEVALDKVLVTEKSSPAASNRYVYYPDHLVRVPAPDSAGKFHLIETLGTLLREPLFETFIWSILTEHQKDSARNGDESVAAFVSRRFSPQIADNLVSSIAHGVFAGDIYRLSAEALMGRFRAMEKEELHLTGALYRKMTSRMVALTMDDLLAIHLLTSEKPEEYWQALRSRFVDGASTLTLKNGLGELADSLVAELNRSNKVEVLTNTDVNGISQSAETSDLTVRYGDSGSRSHHRLIATNPPVDLARQLSNVSDQNAKIPHNTIGALREHNYAVTVMVVNLYYSNPHLLPVRGFGYLIPRSIPYEQNPERALGVIFGSESGEGQDSAPGTKLTVMMGGHWWDGWKESDYPDHDTAVEMARSLLQRHLGIADTPTVARARLQRNAIPQPTVGHVLRVDEISRNIRHDFDKRITLAGAWYAKSGTVGVVDCVRQAYLASSYGLGQKVQGIADKSLLRTLNADDWDLEGGTTTSPMVAVDVPVDALKSSGS